MLTFAHSSYFHDLLGSFSAGVYVTVTDTGPGPDAAALTFAFDPFYTTKAVGVGMGLPIARRRAEDMGGRLELGRGAAGGGAARLSLPGEPPAATAPNQSEAAILP